MITANYWAFRLVSASAGGAPPRRPDGLVAARPRHSWSALGSGGVTGDLIHHYPHDHRCAPVLSSPGSVPSYLCDSRMSSSRSGRASWPPGPGTPHSLRVRGVQDADADPRVAQHVALHLSFDGGRTAGRPVPGRSTSRRWRVVVGIDRGQDGVVPSIQQLQRRRVDEIAMTAPNSGTGAPGRGWVGRSWSPGAPRRATRNRPSACARQSFT